VIALCPTNASLSKSAGIIGHGFSLTTLILSQRLAPLKSHHSSPLASDFSYPKTPKYRDDLSQTGRACHNIIRHTSTLPENPPVVRKLSRTTKTKAYLNHTTSLQSSRKQSTRFTPENEHVSCAFKNVFGMGMLRKEMLGRPKEPHIGLSTLEDGPGPWNGCKMGGGFGCIRTREAVDG